MSLTSFQRYVYTIALAATAGEGRLIGGAAMIERELTSRGSKDGDLAFLEQASLAAHVSAVVAALEATGTVVEFAQQSPAFYRLRVRRGTDEAQLELVVDPRDFDTEASDLGRTATPESLARLKIAALYGRAEPRDLHDLWRLSMVVDLDTTLAAADGDQVLPLDREMLARTVEFIAGKDPELFPFGGEVEQLRDFARALCAALRSGTPIMAALGRDAPPPAGLALAATSTVPSLVCGQWMPRARRTCVLRAGHRPPCR